MKKQHQKPEFTIIDVVMANMKFFAASNPARFQSAGMISPNQESDITPSVPLNSASRYEPSDNNFNW